MIDEKKIEEAADKCAMKHGDVAPFVKRGFMEGAKWADRKFQNIIDYLNKN